MLSGDYQKKSTASGRIVAAVVEFAQSDRRIVATRWDADPWLLNTRWKCGFAEWNAGAISSGSLHDQNHNCCSGRRVPDMDGHISRRGDSHLRGLLFVKQRLQS
jgi:hypothetical protein